MRYESADKPNARSPTKRPWNSSLSGAWLRPKAPPAILIFVSLSERYARICQPTGGEPCVWRRVAVRARRANRSGPIGIRRRRFHSRDLQGKPYSERTPPTSSWRSWTLPGSTAPCLSWSQTDVVRVKAPSRRPWTASLMVCNQLNRIWTRASRAHRS